MSLKVSVTTPQLTDRGTYLVELTHSELNLLRKVQSFRPNFEDNEHVLESLFAGWLASHYPDCLDAAARDNVYLTHRAVIDLSRAIVNTTRVKSSQAVPQDDQDNPLTGKTL